MASTDLRDQLDTDMATVVGEPYTENQTIRDAVIAGLWTVLGMSITAYLDAFRHLPASGVVPGSYTSADITVDAAGIVTAAASGGGGGVTDHTGLSNLLFTASDHVGSAADKMPYFTTAGAAAETSLTAFARTLLDDTTQGAMQTTLDVATAGHNHTGVYEPADGTILKDADIGISVQAADINLDQIAALTPTNSYFIVGNGSSWITETGSTVRTSMGLGTSNAVSFASLTLSSYLLMGSTDQVRLGGSSAYIHGNNSNITYVAGLNDDHIFQQGGSTYATLDGSLESFILSGLGGFVAPSGQGLSWGSPLTDITGTTTDITIDASANVYITCDDFVIETTGSVAYATFNGGLGSLVLSGAGGFVAPSGQGLSWGSPLTDITGTTTDITLDAAGDISLTCDDVFFKTTGSATYASFDGGAKMLNLRYTGSTGIDMLENTNIEWTASSFISGGVGGVSVNTAVAFFVNAPLIQLDSNAKISWTGNTQIWESAGIDLYIEADDDLFLRPDDDLWIYAGTSSWAFFDGGNKRFGVNKSVPLYGLDVIPATAVTYGARISSWGANSYSCLALITAGDSTPDSGDTFIAFQGSTGSIKGSVKGNGTGVTYNTTSDARLKFNVEDMPSMLDVVDAINFVAHEWNADPGRVCFGTIAQDLEKVYPQAVLNPDKANANMRLVWYSKLSSATDKKGKRKPLDKRRTRKFDRDLRTVESLAELRANPDVTVHRARRLKEGDPEYLFYQVDYSQLVVPIGKAHQELRAVVKTQADQITGLLEVVAALTTRLDAAGIA